MAVSLDGLGGGLREQGLRGVTVPPSPAAWRRSRQWATAVATVSTAASAAAGKITAVADAVCLTYAQLLFARRRGVGVLLLAATAVHPRLCITGLLSVLLSMAAARALKLSPEHVRSGALGYNALLAGLGAAALAPLTPQSAVLAVVAVAATVLVAASLHASLTTARGLPVLSLPFLTVYYVLLGAVGHLHLGAHPPAIDPWALAVPALPRAYLRALGTLLFLPRVDAGALVLLALAVHSRIAAVLSALAFTVVVALTAGLGSMDIGGLHAVTMDVGTLDTGCALNAALVAVAVGGVWFVPSAWSYGLALAAVVLSVALYWGLAGHLPPLILPFNLTALLVLHAMRQRTVDGRPHAVDFVPGTPEENLAYFRSRIERFGAARGVRLAAPVRGRWTCTQGVSGGVTHEGPWRHALDLEVLDGAGSTYRDNGAALTDFHCYKLPVVAPAPGVVARVVDGVRDNAVGALNLEQAWGNVVIVAHAPGVYSCVAHLAPGTVAVREGQAVQSGTLLGRCGNSGRSATPHLHFQLQPTDTVGAPTLPLALHDVVTVDPSVGSVLHADHVPGEGEVVRRIESDLDRSRLLRFVYGQAIETRVTGRRGTESVIPDIDLMGRLLLRSSSTDAVLFYDHAPTGFTVHDVVGNTGSALHLVRAALSRVPFDADDTLTWTDRLPLRPFLPGWLRPMFDIMAPFGGRASLTMRYSLRRHGRAVVVEGVSDLRTRHGSPVACTSAWLMPHAGLVQIEVTIRGRTRRVDLSPAVSAPASVSTLSVTEGAVSHG